MYNACDKIVDLKMSIDHILTSINEFEKFKKVAMTDYEHSLFTSMRNLSLQEHKELLEGRFSESKKKSYTITPKDNEMNGFVSRIIDFSNGKN